MADDDGLVWLPLPEAATRLGKSTDAVRSLVRRNKLRTQTGNDGRPRVAVPAGDSQAPVEGRLDDGQTTAELTNELMELRERLGRAEERADAAERVAAAKIDAAQADVRAVREQLDRELARVARLEEELRELRRPWWRRWTGS
jgi:hypothetical protein